MTLAQRIEMFFTNWELVWAAVPGYVKAVIYAALTAIAATYFDSGSINWQFVLKAVVVNLGFYQVPRTVRNIGR